MFILQAKNVVKQYGARTILDFPSFQVYEGDKIGVVGGNGAGKSTLLGVLSGEILPDSGEVDLKFQPVFLKQFGSENSTLSGGERQKKRILEQVDDENIILFADEPTANLDTLGVKWVQRKLQASSTVILVSHDRNLLDAVCTRIVEIKDGRLTEYSGNHSDYAKAVELSRHTREEAYYEYKTKQKQLERAYQLKTQRVARMKRSAKADTSSESRNAKDFLASRAKQSERQAKVMKGRLERLEEVKRPKEPPTLHIDFSLTEPPGNRYVVWTSSLSFSYGDKTIFKDACFSIPRGEKVAICGPNGSGKTTLLHLVHKGDTSLQKAPKLCTGLLNQDFSNINPEKTVLDNALVHNVQSLDVARSTLAGLLFRRDDVFKKAEVLSGGEKMRLSLAMLVLSGINALLLDEPTNYLDIPSLESVGETIRQYPGTVLMVSHDSRFVEETATMKLMIDNCKIVEAYKASKPAPPPDRMLLEMRRIRLVQEIGSAEPHRKDVLEQEYHQILEQLRKMK